MFAPLLSNVPADGTGAAAVQARMRRQAVLDDPDKRFHFIVIEAALRVRVCDPDGMQTQMARLIKETRRPNLRLGIVPLDADVTLTPAHSFTIRDSRVVEIEMYAGQLELTGQDDIRLHHDVFERIDSSAVYDEQARALLAQLAARTG